MRLQTRRDYEERIEAAVRYVLEHLDGPIEPRALADHVCFSRFHFHRVFQALAGETLGDLLRRLRLERSVQHLRFGSAPITEIALDAGYATPSAFVRAFRGAFGCTPSAMRRHGEYDGRLPTPNGVHFGEPLRVRFAPPPGETKITFEIRELPPRRAVCMAHRGYYYMIGMTFGRFAGWVGETRAPVGPFVGLYYDCPESTPPDEMRSHAGALVPDDFATNDPRVCAVTIAGGPHAVGTYVGPYDAMSGAWADLMGQVMQLPGYTLAPAPGVEIYVRDCEEVGMENAVTELYVPLAPSSSGTALAHIAAPRQNESVPADGEPGCPASPQPNPTCGKMRATSTSSS
jgi:AraC family transcriptional regulator